MIFDKDNWGRYEITKKSIDKGKFKTPTLRNIEVTRPYMHDGRFASLMEVVEFYNSGKKPSLSLDSIMTKPGKEQGLNLTLQEKMGLVNFLKTFTDYEYLSNPAYSSPFN